MNSVLEGFGAVGEPHIFQSLQDTVNFTYTSSKPEDEEWGTWIDGAENNSWTRMVAQFSCKGEILMLVKCGRVEHSVDYHTSKTLYAVIDFTVTEERSQVMTFASPITKIYNSFFSKNPAKLTQNPFTGKSG
jgi:hypothetical protein